MRDINDKEGDFLQKKSGLVGKKLQAFFLREMGEMDDNGQYGGYWTIDTHLNTQI